MMNVGIEMSSVNFPLEQWFNLTSPINKRDLEIVEAQIRLYALKDDIDTNSDEVNFICKQLHQAVKNHNKQMSPEPVKAQKDYILSSNKWKAF